MTNTPFIGCCDAAVRLVEAGLYNGVLLESCKTSAEDKNQALICAPIEFSINAPD